MGGFQRSLLFIPLLALLACGGGDDEAGDDNHATGNLRLSVHVLGEEADAGVTLVRLELRSRSAGGSNYVVDLLRFGTAGSWAAEARGVRMDVYDAKALAYADEAGERLLFVSPRAEAVAQRGHTGAVIILMDPHVDELPASGRPRFTALSLDKIFTEPGGQVGIRVQGAGGAGALTLSGWFPPGSPGASRGSFSEGAPFGLFGSEYLVWTAPYRTGLRWFGLRLEDEAGNRSELGLTVMVDAPGAHFPLTWNLSPTIEIKSQVFQDQELTRAHLWLIASDDWEGALRYEWSGTCDGGFLTDPEQEGGAPQEGSFAPSDLFDERPALFFHYTLPAFAEPCELRVRVWDESGVGSTGSVRLYPWPG